jgi:choline transport protein
MGLATAFPFTIACMFAIVDVEAVIGTATGLPLIEIYYQGTGSKAGASVLMALFCLLLLWLSGWQWYADLKQSNS